MKTNARETRETHEKPEAGPPSPLNGERAGVRGEITWEASAFLLLGAVVWSVLCFLLGQWVGVHRAYNAMMEGLGR